MSISQNTSGRVTFRNALYRERVSVLKSKKKATANFDLSRSFNCLLTRTLDGKSGALNILCDQKISKHWDPGS